MDGWEGRIDRRYITGAYRQLIVSIYNMYNNIFIGKDI